MRYPFGRFVPLLSIFLFIGTLSFAQENVVTQHNNIERTGWNSKETILNKSNVRIGSFGKLFTRSVDDQVYAQPLVMQ